MLSTDGLIKSSALSGEIAPLDGVVVEGAVELVTAGFTEASVVGGAIGMVGGRLAAELGLAPNSPKMANANMRFFM